MDILNKVKQLNNEMCLWNDDDAILVACSGGPDSMALLNILLILTRNSQNRIGVFCLDHQLRPESKTELELVKVFALRNNLSFYGMSEDVNLYSKTKKISLEMAGRELRYKHLGEIARRENYTKIALAHHADDQVETVLSHFLRGSGLDGMMGMLPQRDKFIRPLLEISKQEILDYLKYENIEYALDESNNSFIYERNRLRHELIPNLKNFNPQVKNAIRRISYLARIENDFFDECIEALKLEVLENTENEKIIIKRNLLKSKHRALRYRFWRYILAKFYPEGSTPSLKNIEDIDEIVFSSGNKQICLKGVKIYSQYDKIYIVWHNDEAITTANNFKKSIVYHSDYIEKIGLGMFKIPSRLIQDELIIRSKLPGDRIVILNKKKFIIGHKSLKKYINEKKIPREEREHLLWLASGNTVFGLVNSNLKLEIMDENATDYIWGHFEEDNK